MKESESDFVSGSSMRRHVHDFVSGSWMRCHVQERKSDLVAGSCVSCRVQESESALRCTLVLLLVPLASHDPHHHGEGSHHSMHLV